jgi:lysozyme
MSILKFGSKGAEVQALQQQLLKSGYKVDVDGIFGHDTEKIVIKFQKDFGLTPDGIVGPQVKSKLQEILTPVVIEGVDISHHNGIVNWQKLKTEAGFVYCKASQGAQFKDPLFTGYFSAATQAGLPRGAYHFLTFENATAAQQVANFLGTGINFNAQGTLPPVLDVEWQVPDTLNPYIIANKAACIQLIKDWLTGVQTQTGRKPMIYTNKVFWHDYLGNPPGFNDYQLWIAAYQSAQPTLPPGWTNATLWQYTGNGKIAGVSGDVDRDRFYGTQADFKKLALL